MKILKNNIKIIIAFVLGLVLSGVGVYAATVASKDVTYNSTNVEAAINDLYSKVNAANGWKWKIESIKNGNITLDVSKANTIHFDKIYSTGCYDFGDGTGCWPGYLRVKAKKTTDSDYTTLASISQKTYTDYSLDISDYDIVYIVEAQHANHRLSQTGAEGITAY